MYLIMPRLQNFTTVTSEDAVRMSRCSSCSSETENVVIYQESHEYLKGHASLTPFKKKTYLPLYIYVSL